MKLIQTSPGPKRVTGPTRIINTTEIPSVVFFIASAHVFYYKKLVKKPSRKKPRKNPGQKKSWARSSRKFLQKTNTKFKTTTRAPSAPAPKMGRRLRRRPIFGVVVMNFELVFLK